MPKGKKKGKYEHKRTEQGYSSDEDAGIDMTIDNMSETSGQSDLKSIHDEADAEIQEKFEEKVMETIDGLGARANAARAAALVSLRAALQRRYLAPLLANHRATLADHLTKAIRRGRDGERKAAAALAPLLALQIGEEGIEEFVKEVRPALAACAVDKTASIETRTECCLSLSVICYLLEEDLSEILDVMRIYETIFSGSYLKGDGTVKVTGLAVEAGALHAAALDGWALLLSLPPAEHAAALLRSAPPGLPRLADLLAAASLEVGVGVQGGSVEATAAVEAGALHAAALDGWALLLSLPPAEHAAALLRSAPPGLPRLADLLAAASLEVGVGVQGGSVEATAAVEAGALHAAALDGWALLLSLPPAEHAAALLRSAPPGLPRLADLLAAASLEVGVGVQGGSVEATAAVEAGALHAAALDGWALLLSLPPAEHAAALLRSAPPGLPRLADLLAAASLEVGVGVQGGSVEATAAVEAGALHAAALDGWALLLSLPPAEHAAALLRSAPPGLPRLADLLAAASLEVGVGVQGGSVEATAAVEAGALHAAALDGWALLLSLPPAEHAAALLRSAPPGLPRLADLLAAASLEVGVGVQGGSVEATAAVEAGALHAAALDGWALLLSLPPAEHAAALLRSAPPGLPRLADLLAAASLEVGVGVQGGSVEATAAVEAGALHAAALDGWALLLSLPPAEHAAALLRSAPPGLPRLADLLAAASLEVGVGVQGGSVEATAAVEAGALHAAALDGWALLLSLPPAEHAAALLRSAPPGLPRLADLLAAASLEVGVGVQGGSVEATAAVEAGALHAAALDGWALLLSLPPAEHAAALLRSAPPGLPRLADLLAAASLEVRMAAGGALAIAFECIAETDAGDEAAEYVEGLLPRLDELARDSHKFRAKKERKLQRATFRDILKYFEEDIVPSLRVRVGTESVECGTWWSRAAYGALAATLGAGLQALAPHSAALRAALRLPDVQPAHAHAPKQKLNKLHRHLANNAADKARTVARGKNRDKRSAALAV